MVVQEAFKCYVRTRDYCTTSKHIWTTCLNVIRVSIELGNFNHVSNYVTKAEQTPDIKARSLQNVANTDGVHSAESCPGCLLLGAPLETTASAILAALQTQPDVVAKLTAASGLALLDSKRYKQAARKFTEVRLRGATLIAPQTSLFRWSSTQQAWLLDNEQHEAAAGSSSRRWHAFAGECRAGIQLE